MIRTPRYASRRLVAPLALALGVALTLASPAAAEEWFVAPGGDDAAAGASPETAFASIAHAAEVARAGDVVSIRPGVYEGRVRPAHSGQPGAPIVYRRAGDGEAVVTTSTETDGGPWLERFAFKLGEGRNWTVIDGLTFRDAEAWIYIGDGARHNTVRNCTFDGSRMYHGIFINNGSRNTIAGCRFVRATTLPEDWAEDFPPKSLADYISIWRDSHYNLVTDNTFGQISHVAVCIMGHDPGHVASYNIVRNNAFDNPMWKCVSTHASEFTLIENNRMTGTAASFIQLQGFRVIVRRNVFAGYKFVGTEGSPSDYHGALWMRSVVNEYGSMDLCQNNRIYHNTFADNEVAVTYGPHPKALPVCENVFKNNIFARSGQALRVPTPFYAHFTSQQANYWTNNLLMGDEPGAELFELAGLEERLRLSLDEVRKRSPELARRQLFVGNIEAEPRFVAPDKSNYRLAVGSPAIDAGAPLARTTAAGQGTVITVDDPLYFCDGWQRIPGDRIRVGDNEPVTIVAVNVPEKRLTVARPIEWNAGDPVFLPYAGERPDIGAYEHGMEQPPVGGGAE